jgi:hypothetical protein
LAVPIKTIQDCTDKQKLFLQYLASVEVMDQPVKLRWRWAMTQAGYSEDTAVSSVVQPLQHLMKEVAEQILARGVVEATWQLMGAVGDGTIDAQTKDRLAASRDILDRVVPKRQEAAPKELQVTTILVLPVKQETLQLTSENVKNAEISTVETGEAN